MAVEFSCPQVYHFVLTPLSICIMVLRKKQEPTMENDSQPQKATENCPGDFCRTCRGKGYTTDLEYRWGVGTVSVTGTCWACNGTGFGK
jgi:DnaJ-class molecular chaperone